jgi:WD40 repeat protein
MHRQLLCCFLLSGLLLLSLKQGWSDDPKTEDKSGKSGPDKPAAVDVLGDPLPAHAVARLGTQRLRHGHFLMALAFTPDGKQVLSAGQDQKVRMWDVATGKELWESGEHVGRFFCLALSPDGKTAAASGDGNKGPAGPENAFVLILDALTGKTIRELEMRRLKMDDAPGISVVDALAFLRDGKTLAVTAFPHIRLYDWSVGKETRRFPDPYGGSKTLAVSPDGNTLAAGRHDGIVRLWDLTGGKELHELKGHKEMVYSVAFSPDGKTLVSGGEDRTVRVWEVASGRLLHLLEGHGGRVTAVAFRNDGKTVASGGDDAAVHLWDVVRGKEWKQFPVVRSRIMGVVFSPDGKTLAAGVDGRRIALWDVENGKELLPLPGHSSGVSGAVFSPDGTTVATGGYDGTARLWSAATGKELRGFSGHHDGAQEVAFFLDGKTLAALDDYPKKVRLWNLASGEEQSSFREPQVREFAWARFSADGRTLVSASGDGMLGLWETTTGKQIRRFRGYQDGLYDPILSPDGSRLAAYTVERGPGSLPAGSTWEPAIGVRVWEAATGKLLREWPSDKKIYRLAFSPDGRTLAAGLRGGEVVLWEVATARERGRFQAHPKIRWSGGMALAFSPDGRTLASASEDGTIRLWEPATGKRLAELPGHRGPVGSLAFSPNGKALVSASVDTTALVWDVAEWTSKPAGATLQAEQLTTLWNDLAGADAKKAYRAIGTLAAAPDQVLPLLRKQLQPVPPADPRRLARLIADLDDEQQAVRDKATAELSKQADLAEDLLRKALANPPSQEARRRLEKLLELVDGPTLPAEQMRVLRAIELLERIGTTPARQLLTTLAEGAPKARVTREAKTSLDRLVKQFGPKP